MDINTFELLKSYDVQQIINENLQQEVTAFALRFQSPHYPTAPLATQIKYLQKSQQKLPTFYQHRCIIPPLSYEQCSSELAAKLKKVASGKRCLDLTCGLGIDALYFAEKFETVIALEKNELLAQVAEYNFEKIGKKTVHILAQSAEDYVEQYEGAPFDLIYLDPARRDNAGGKIFLPQDCSPNLVELLPKLLKMGKKVMAKLSPLYDVNEALRQFSPYLTELCVISIENECKELLLSFEKENTSTPQQTIICHTAKNGTQVFEIEQASASSKTADKKGIATYRYLYEPDVAFYKCNAVAQLFNNREGFLTAANGFFLSNEEIEPFTGRVFHIHSVETYKPDVLKKSLKLQVMKQVNLLQRNFPMNSQQIQQQLKVNSGGGDTFLIFTTIFSPEKELLVFHSTRK